MRKIINGEKIDFGVCYYPEHWDKSLWESDLDRMLEAGLHTVRIAEFAWSFIEKRENEFDDSFFDGFLDLCEKKGMQVIMCTPTATPPAWVTNKYPETLNADIEGNLYHHDGRRHYNYNSPKYRELTEKIVTHMAEHYGQRKCVIGWQIDNELNCEINEFYSKSDEAAFREFVKNKYKDLDALNDSWGCAFWNQIYTDWEEVKLPQKTTIGTVNPHKLLDYYRFISDSTRRFAKLQSDILRKYIKEDDFVTTNGVFGNIENTEMTKESLDFMTFDSYPNFAYCLDSYDKGEGALHDRWGIRGLMETRALSNPFGIMEQQSGANGWTTKMEAPTPRPGQIMLWTMQSVAHGADYISYFRWRTSTIGTEMYWHGILDYSGRDNRRLSEIKDITKRLGNMSEIAGSLYEARVGLIKDYDNIFDIQTDKWHKRVNDVSENAVFTACAVSHTPYDFVYLNDDTDPEKLEKYDILFYPHATLINEKRAQILEEYVKEGGKLVIGCRSGYKDMNGRCVMDKLPGLLSSLTGTDIPEYSFIAPDAEPVTISFDGDELKAKVFTDLLMPKGGTVVGTYTSDYYEKTPAIIRNKFGKGEAYYYGSALSEETVLAFLRKLGGISPYDSIVRAPKEVEIAVRTKGKRHYLFLLNYLKTPSEVEFTSHVRDLESGLDIKGKTVLGGYETKVYFFE